MMFVSKITPAARTRMLVGSFMDMLFKPINIASAAVDEYCKTHKQVIRII